MIVKLLNEHHLEFLSLKGDCRGSTESTLVKMSNWKFHAVAHLSLRSLFCLFLRGRNREENSKDDNSDMTFRTQQSKANSCPVPIVPETGIKIL